MAKLISKTYGEAIFELAVSENKLDAFQEEIQMILELLKENPEFSALMKHPKIPREEKLQVVESAFHGKVSDEITGFLRLIVEKGRYENLEEILHYFLEQVKREKGIGVAFVTSAVSLSETQQKAVEDKLLATAGFREMEMHYAVDESLIGGVMIRIGDHVVDSSIRTKLENLSRELMKIQLQN